ncbi:MAG: AAA family ATPase [Smithella sp.]|jgi:hypothetical protein
MALKAKKPENVEKRLKMFLYGEAGVGKTLAALQFPNAYIIDTEKGTDFYSETIKKNNSVVLQTNLPDDVRTEIKELLTTKHEYRTLIIDPITQIYNALQEKWTRVFEKNAKTQKESEIQDFGMRYWQKVKAEFKSLQRLILALDMNVIITSHQKDVYAAGFNKVGVTYDSMKGEDYLYDLVFRMDRRGDKRVAVTIKERADMGSAKFPESFEWSYENFLKYYGKEIIEREAAPSALADIGTVRRVENMINMLKMDEDVINKWMTKADVDSFSEMTQEQIVKCEEYLNKKLAELTGEKKGLKK